MRGDSESWDSASRVVDWGSSEHEDSASHRVDSTSRVSQEADFDFDFDQGLTS